MMLSALPSPNGHSLLTSRKMLGERNPTPLPQETRIVEYLLSRTWELRILRAALWWLL